MRTRLMIIAAVILTTAFPALAQTDLDGSFPADAAVDFATMHKAI